MVSGTAMIRRYLPALLLAALSATAQKYDGPRPPKPDLPYLKHADNLIPTESLIAQENKKKDDITYTVDGASSPAATPLASPIFLLQADKLVPEKIELYKLESKNGHREITFSPRKKESMAIRVVVSRLTPDRIWKIEVDESLDPGEYCLTQAEDPSNAVFCFRVR